MRVLAGACAAALLLAACSWDADTTPGSGQSGSESSVLEGLTEEQMCELLSDESIEGALDVQVKERRGTRRGKPPLFLTSECRYNTEEVFPNLATDLTTTSPRDGDDREVLDVVFTDHTEDAEPIGDYERVPGLGALAGFGPDPVLGKADANAWDLGVVFRIGEERLRLTLSVQGRAELKQVRPLAEELLANLESAVG